MNGNNFYSNNSKLDAPNDINSKTNKNRTINLNNL